MSFRANALAMLTGTVAAQAIPLLFAPVLSRLYSPESFGLQSLFMGIVATLAVLATCRFDLAIVLPFGRFAVNALTAVITALCVTVCAIALVVIFIVGDELRDATSYGALTVWMWLIPAMVMAVASFQLLVAYATRARDFQIVAKGNVVVQAGYVFTALCVGYFWASPEGLVWGKLIGQLLAVSFIGLLYGPEILSALRRIDRRGMKAAVRRYRQYILFNTPYSLMGTLGRDAPVFIFSAFTMIAAAGHYGLARMILLAPTLLISNALSQVFFREAVGKRESVGFASFTQALLRVGLVVSAPLFAFCAVWGEQLFVILFGEEWRVAGKFGQLMAPAAWWAVQTGWPERLFDVNMRQGVSFSIQILSDISTALIFTVTYIYTTDITAAVAAFALCNVIYHHAFLFALFRIARFELRRLMGLLLVGWGSFFVAYSLLWATHQIGLNIYVSAVLAVLLAGLFGRPLWRAVWRFNG